MRLFQVRSAMFFKAAMLFPLSAIATDLAQSWPLWRGPSHDGQAYLTPIWPERVEWEPGDTSNLPRGPHPAVCGEEFFIRDLKGRTVYRWSAALQRRMAPS